MNNNKGFKTVAEYEAIKASKLAELTNLVSRYNDTDDKTEGDTLETSIKTVQKEYNDASRCIVLLNCLESEENTIAAACRIRVFPIVKVVSKKLESGAKMLEVDTSDVKLIDLTGFNKTLLTAWYYRAELLCSLLTQETAASLGYDKARLSDMMRFFKISEEAATAPKISKSTLKKVIPEIVGQMIGEEYAEKVLPCDIAHLMEGFTRDDSKVSLTTKTASTKQTIKLLADICHRVLTDGYYTVDSKQVKIK